MGGSTAGVVAALVCGGLVAASSPRADEPFWHSRPVSHWVGVLQTGDTVARTEAARGLAEIALAHGAEAVHPAIPSLREALASPAVELRAAAAAVFEQVGPPAAGVAPALLNLFEHDPDAGVRAHAGLALMRIVPLDPAVVEASARVLGRDADAGVRQAAAAALVQAGAAAEPALPALQRALSDGDAIVRVFAAAGVGQFGQTGAAIPVLLAGLGHEDPAVRVEAAGQLAAVAPAHAAAIAPLTSALGDRDAQVRLAAADALGHIGQPARPALQSLWRLIRDEDEGVRESALRAIRRIRD